MKRLILPVLLAMVAASTAAAQGPGRIVGTVTSSGRILPGASVSVLGSAQLAVVQPDGTYELVALPGTYQLQARLIGYAPLTREVTVGADQTVTVDFELTIAPLQLEGLVVVGYTLTQERRVVTGSIGTVAPEAVKDIPTNDVMRSVQGRIAGVDVVSSNYRPGAPMNVRIRGVRSMVATNDPLYVVDGIPISGGIEDFDAQNIKSIEVLKDASATAIYGSRGANGVVLITTGAERASGTTFSYDMYFGPQKAINLVDMMNAYEFSRVKKEAWRAAGRDTSDQNVFEPKEQVTIDAVRACIAAGNSPDACPSSNWQQLISETGFQQNHQFAVQSATENTRLSVTANYFDQSGLTQGQGYRRYGGTVSLEHTIGRLRLGVSAVGTRSGSDINAGNGIWGLALPTNPLGQPYDSLGNLDWKPTSDPLIVNPIVQNQNFLRTITRDRYFGSIFTEFQLMEGLNWRLNFGPDVSSQTDGEFHGPQTTVRNGTPADAWRNEQRTFAYTLDNLLTFRRDFGSNHRVIVTGLYGIQESRLETTRAAAANLPYDQQLWYNLGTGEVRSDVQSSLSEWALRSYMARVNYRYADKYLVTVTGRWDGSSRLAPDNRWAFFPSVGLGWLIGDEPFMQRFNFLSALKLRASYGRTGNTGIDPYQTQGSVTQTRYNFGSASANGYRPGQIPNPDLGWEKTDQFDVGLDFGILNNRVSATVDYYVQNTHDLLMARQLPATSGFTSTLQNIGETKNSGIEFAVSATPVEGAVRWTVDFNASHNHNEIVSLYGAKEDDVGNNWFIGQPIHIANDPYRRVHYDYQFDGIWQLEDSALAASYGAQPGWIRVVDQNGDGQINADDRVLLGNTYPNWVGSIYNRVTWKALDLSFLFTYRLGYTLYDSFGVDNTRLDGRYNDMDVQYWTLDKCGATRNDAVWNCNLNPGPNSGREAPLYSSTRGYLSGGHARIRNITVGVTLPQRWAGMIGARTIRLYGVAQEPFLFSDYHGYDPEGGTSGSPPSYRTFVFGANVGF